GFCLAVFLVPKFAYSLGGTIESITGIEIYLSEIIAGILIFLGVIFVFGVIKRFVHPFDNVLNSINQLTGVRVGRRQILFYLSGYLIILDIFNAPVKQSKENSLLYNKVYKIIPATIEYISKRYEAEPKKVLKNYIIDKDTIR